LAEDGKTLVTGSRDTTVIAWELIPRGSELSVRQETRRIFYGHDEEVTSVAVNIEHDMVLSGSKVNLRFLVPPACFLSPL
jgi:WD40 repeat protein